MLTVICKAAATLPNPHVGLKSNAFGGWAMAGLWQQGKKNELFQNTALLRCKGSHIWQCKDELTVSVTRKLYAFYTMPNCMWSQSNAS